MWSSVTGCGGGGSSRFRVVGPDDGDGSEVGVLRRLFVEPSGSEIDEAKSVSSTLVDDGTRSGLVTISLPSTFTGAALSRVCFGEGTTEVGFLAGKELSGGPPGFCGGTAGDSPEDLFGATGGVVILGMFRRLESSYQQILGSCCAAGGPKGRAGGKGTKAFNIRSRLEEIAPPLKN